MNINNRPNSQDTSRLHTLLHAAGMVDAQRMASSTAAVDSDLQLDDADERMDAQSVSSPDGQPAGSGRVSAPAAADGARHVCTVCGDESDGLHFGQYTCRACEFINFWFGFFGTEKI